MLASGNGLQEARHFLIKRVFIIKPQSVTLGVQHTEGQDMRLRTLKH
jgi:hypothetical protein